MLQSVSLRLLMVASLSASLVLTSCKSKEDNQARQGNTQTATRTNTTVTTNGDAADGLDLSRLPALVREAKDGESLEKLLNESGINNLDFNQDGNIDYLNVEEFREDLVRGFVLFTNENNERMDVAKVELQTQQETTQVSVQGNPQYYGANPPAYQSSFPLGQILLAAWLFDMARPRYYHPPYHYGRYPSYYSARKPISRTLYRSRVSSNSFTANGRSLGGSAARRTGSTPASLGSSRTTTPNSRTMTGGSSFSTTGQKRPAGSSTSSSGFGSSSSRTAPGTTGSSSSTRAGSSTGSVRSTTSGGSFGSSSSRSRPSFGSSSSRSSGSSSFGSSSRRSGGSSSRRRR
ncbi:MAG: hypothetical protein ACO1RX_05930 [Candidatus Sericytochromatia bacterium]